MNLQDMLALLDKLRSIGAHRFKCPELEVDLCKDQPTTLHIPPDNVNMATPVPEPPINQANTKKAQDLIDLLKAKDEELVNRIFPEGA